MARGDREIRRRPLPFVSGTASGGVRNRLGRLYREA